MGYLLFYAFTRVLCLFIYVGLILLLKKYNEDYTEEDIKKFIENATIYMGFALVPSTVELVVVLFVILVACYPFSLVYQAGVKWVLKK